jgi:hypothetical protein
MPPATGGLPPEPSDDSDRASVPATPDAGPPAARGHQAADPGRGAYVAPGFGVIIPVTRRSPDDHPAEYPGLTGTSWPSVPAERRPSPPRPATPRADDDPASPVDASTAEDRATEADEPVPAASPGCADESTNSAPSTQETTPEAGIPTATRNEMVPAASDRRQFHRIAGAVMGALLVQGQILEVSGMLAASPVHLALDRADNLLAQALRAHEVLPPAHVLTQTARLHRGLERLARRRMPDSQWKRLRVLAGRVSVLRADAAFKQGNVAAARVLTTQGYTAGLAAGDGALCGSAREVGAVAEFYDGRPDEALRLARDGQCHVSSGPVRVRLVCQEARALAGLGDVQGAARALDHAYDLADEISPDRWGRPGPSFDEFNPVEVSYNATTALCLLGRPRAAEEHAELAMPKLDRMDAPGFRSVIRLDLSLALARSGRLDLERACQLATDAIQISWGRTVASVSGRADQVLAATRPHSEVPQVRDLASLVREWQRTADRQRPGPVTTSRITTAGDAAPRPETSV